MRIVATSINNKTMNNEEDKIKSRWFSMESINQQIRIFEYWLNEN
jgi:hypothetical protein